MQFRKNPAMEFIESDEDNLVVFDPASGDTCIVDEIGAAIFRAMGDGASLESIVSCLTQEYAASAEEIQQDVKEFLNQLMQQGIVQSCESVTLI